MAPPRRGRQWTITRPPWWLLALTGGVFLAALATAMQVNDWPGGGLFVFLLASAAILAGLVGLGRIVLARRKQQTAEEEEPASPPKVHRRAPCRIEPPLLERLARAVTILKQRAEDDGWSPDWPVYERHRTLADQLLAANDLPGDFPRVLPSYVSAKPRTEPPS